MEKPYYQTDHTHCWSQGKNPACGLARDTHTKCCLCALPRPSQHIEKKCCSVCEIHLPYKEKNEYQCNDGECPCHSPIEKNCTCASFFTVRGTHKKDCPASIEKNGWEAIRSCIEKNPHERYGRVDTWELDEAIKNLVALSYQAGRSDGITEEALGCDEHTRKAFQHGKDAAVNHLDMLLSANMEYTQGELDVFFREARTQEVGYKD